MHRMFLPLAEEITCKRMDSGKMLLDIAHLVDKKTVERYQNKYSTATLELKDCAMHVRPLAPVPLRPPPLGYRRSTTLHNAVTPGLRIETGGAHTLIEAEAQPRHRFPSRRLPNLVSSSFSLLHVGDAGGSTLVYKRRMRLLEGKIVLITGLSGIRLGYGVCRRRRGGAAAAVGAASGVLRELEAPLMEAGAAAFRLDVRDRAGFHAAITGLAEALEGHPRSGQQCGAEPRAGEISTKTIRRTGTR